MARFKNISHGLHTHSMEKVPHIRPANWDNKVEEERHNRQPRLVNLRGPEISTEQTEAVDPRLVDPKALIVLPLMQIYKQFRDSCAKIL